MENGLYRVIVTIIPVNDDDGLEKNEDGEKRIDLGYSRGKGESIAVGGGFHVGADEMDDSRPLAWAPVGAICQIRQLDEE